LHDITYIPPKSRILFVIIELVVIRSHRHGIGKLPIRPAYNWIPIFTNNNAESKGLVSKFIGGASDEEVSIVIHNVITTPIIEGWVLSLGRVREQDTEESINSLNGRIPNIVQRTANCFSKVDHASYNKIDSSGDRPRN